MSKLALSLLFGLTGLLARQGGDGPACLDASLDRFEDVEAGERLAVLDVVDYPAVNIPAEMAKGFPEGVPVKLCVAVDDQGIMQVWLRRDTAREEAIKREIERIRREYSTTPTPEQSHE